MSYCPGYRAGGERGARLGDMMAERGERLVLRRHRVEVLSHHLPAPGPDVGDRLVHSPLQTTLDLRASRIVDRRQVFRALRRRASNGAHPGRGGLSSPMSSALGDCACFNHSLRIIVEDSSLADYAAFLV